MRQSFLVTHVLKIIKRKLWNSIKQFSDVKTNKIDCRIYTFCDFSENPEIYQNSKKS